MVLARPMMDGEPGMFDMFVRIEKSPLFLLSVGYSLVWQEYMQHKIRT